MSLLGKFSNFEVKSTDRISEEDKEFLQHHEKMYKNALSVYKRVYSLYKEEYEKYSQDVIKQYEYSDFLVGDFGIPKKIDSVQKAYASYIYSYFERKYKVSLENNFKESDLERKYYRYNRNDEIKELEVTEIDYNKIIDDIIDQLGGLSFADRAIKEVKDALKDKCYNGYHDDWNIKVKGNTITYSGYGYVDDAWHRGNYEVHSPDFIRKFMEAVSMERYGDKRHICGLDCIYEYSVYLDEDEMKNGLFPVDVPVEKIKFFKNGRIDIKFKEAEQARKFAREWCGYTLV